MIMTRTALTPEVGYHQLLIDCGVVEALVDIMTKKINFVRSITVEKKEHKTRIAHQMRTGGRAAHLIGLLAYSNEKTCDLLVRRKTVESLVMVLDSFRILSNPPFKKYVDVYLCALQSVKASSCALGQIAHYRRENAIKVLEDETTLNNLLWVLTSEAKDVMKSFLESENISKDFPRVSKANQWFSSTSWMNF